MKIKLTPNQQIYQKELKLLKRRISALRRKGYIFSDEIIPEQPKRVTKKQIENIRSYRGEKLKLQAESVFDEIYQEMLSPKQAIEIEKNKKYERQRITKRANLFEQVKKIFKSTISQGKPMSDKELQLWKRLDDKEQWEIIRDRWKEEKTKEEVENDRDDLEDAVISKPEEFYTENELLDGVFSDSVASSETYNIIENIREQIDQWTPSMNWTKTLENIKSQDVNAIMNMLNGAIEEYGADVVAQRLQSRASEVNSLLQEILYGSGDKEGNFKNAQTAVNFDLSTFSAILTGRELTKIERARIEDLMLYQGVDN